MYTHGPGTSIGVHVTVDMHRAGGTTRVDGVHPTGTAALTLLDVITVSGQVELGVDTHYWNQER